MIEPMSMPDKKSKNSDIQLHWKRVIIIAVILVTVHLVGISGGYDYLSEISPIHRDMPISIIESSLNKQCQELKEEFTILKDFLKIDEKIANDEIEKIAWADYQYYTKLEMKLDQLKC